MDYLLLFAGFIILLGSGDFLIRGSVSLAGHFKVSKMVVGIVIVSLGTSAPELAVSVKAALGGQSDIAIGNVVGSNISNIALVLGLTAVILPIVVKKNTILFDWAVMFLASILLLAFSYNHELSFVEGVIFLGLLGFFIIRSFHHSRKAQKNELEKPVESKYSLWISLMFVVFSCGGLILGATFLVDGATGIARSFGVSERVISVSLIAFGTSVPELATSIMAAIRKELDIFVGNIVGSNIFNILAILGVTAMLKNIDINPKMLSFDYLWMIGISALLFLFILPLRKGRVGRIKGLIFVSIYAAYIYMVYVK